MDGVAAPIAGQILGEVLPYLELKKNLEEEEQKKLEIEMPDVTGITLKEAKTKLKELGLEYNVDTKNLEAVITEQIPKEGIKIKQGTKVILYSE